METLTRRGIAWPDLEALQASLVDRVRRNPLESFLLVSEPLPVFTTGRSGTPDELLWKDPEKHGVSVHAVDRGGRWTFHGPGQIVLYPILSLPKFGFPKRAARNFLGRLAGCAQSFLKEWGIESEVRDEPLGIYLPNGGKLASIGMSLREGISSHGIAVYLKPQTAFFRGIHPCGMTNPSIASIEEAGVEISWEQAAETLVAQFKRGFQASKN